MERKYEKNIKKGKKKTKPKSSCMRSGRRPIPEGTRLLFAGTINLMICPGDVPTEGRHKTRRKARKGAGTPTQNSFSMSSWWGNTQETQGKAETDITKTKSNSNTG